MRALAAIAAGAVLGAWLRFGLSVWLNALLPQLPPGTLIANLIGAYLIGIAVAIFSSQLQLAPELRALVVTGFLGSLTTFSTFSAEAVALVERGQHLWALAHSAAHLFGSLLLTWLGMITAKALALP